MRKGSASRANTIRRAGARVTHGPWVLYIAPKSQPTHSRFIVALGRRAGGAVTRSRIRRIARDSFRTFRSTDTEFDALLLARGDVALQPRRSVRKVLYGLLERGKGALSKPDTSGDGARE